MPPDGAIDARQPSDPDGSNPGGWLWIDMLLNGDLSELTPEQFTVTQEGAVGAAPFVLALDRSIQGEICLVENSCR